MGEELEHDHDLATRARSALGRHHDAFVVTTVREGTPRVAAVGLPATADVEIGSVSKGLTGLLLADARDRGVVRDDTRLGDLLPLGDAAVADVHLGALATHTSGLPRLAAGSGALRATWELWTRGANPYGETRDELLRRARATTVGRPRVHYSNLGGMLLGHALAAAAGTSYAALLHDRLTLTTGMRRTYVPATPAELRRGWVAGRNRRGRPVEPWTGEGLGPAGGVRSTAADLARLVGALLDGSAPGVSALDPVRPFAGRALRIGAGWLTLDRRGVALTWHNGGTGGFRSIVALDRAAGCGVAVVSATTRSVDPAGFALLEGLVGRDG